MDETMNNKNDDIITIDVMLEYCQKMKNKGYGNIPVTINNQVISRNNGYYNYISPLSAKFDLKYEK